MNPQIKARWVAALRSGDYTQGKGALRRGDEYCCLGVLCDLHRIETGETEWVPGGAYDWKGRKGRAIWTYARSAISLPNAVALWAGLYVPSPVVGESQLSELNDGGATFAVIADLIEAQL